MAEDVDYFKFRAEAGQTLTFEVYCARIQDKIHDLQKHADPMVSIHDAEGREIRKVPAQSPSDARTHFTG